MKLIIALLFCSMFCSPGNAQFDSSGYRFLCYYDGENANLTTKFTDTNYYLLRNTGKVKEGLILECHNLINPNTYTLAYLFDPSVKQRAISHIEIEQFAFRDGKLAIMSNQGIYMAHHSGDPLRLLTSELTAFEYDGLELHDSILLVYRNSHKTYGPFMEIVSIHIKTGIIIPNVKEDDVAASIYSNFHDTRLLDFNSGIPLRADYVLPLIYRYGVHTDTFSLVVDPTYAKINQSCLMPEELIGYMGTYASESNPVFFDTTLKLLHAFYSNRFMSTSPNGQKIVLLSSIPQKETPYNPQFILSEWLVGDSTLIMDKFTTIQRLNRGDTAIKHALEVINLWGTTHLTEDHNAWYFVIRKATPLSPAGKTATAYYKANYSLQFENTGFAVIRLEKGNR